MSAQEPYTLVTSRESLSSLVNDLALYDIAAVDTEADSMYHYSVRLCLIQITIGDHHWIVDPLSDIDISPIFQTRAMQSLIFHGADYDLRMLWNRFGFSPKHVFDTMLAAKLLGEDRLGLASLVEKYFGIHLAKDNQKADWTQRPLPQDMCDYAIHDTLYLHELCAILGEQLQQEGKFGWLMEICDQLIVSSRIQHAPPQDPWRIAGSHRLSPKSLNILKYLWKWREAEAEAMDRPPYKVLGAELMLAIVRSASHQSFSLDMASLPRLPRNFSGQRLDSFRKILEKAIAVPEAEWPMITGKPAQPFITPDSDLLEALKIWRDQKASALKLDPTLLANRSQLIALATPNANQWQERYESAHFMQWQKNIWNKILCEHLS